MNPNILIFDNDNFDRAKSCAIALVKAGANARIFYDDHFYDHSGKPALQDIFLSQFIFYHIGNKKALLAAYNEDILKISYSGGMGADIPRPIGIEGFATEEAERIVSALSQPAQPSRGQILDIWIDQSANVAFRLLCEAVVLSKKNAIGKVCGIPITAPTQPEHWMNPFSPNGNPDEQRIDDIVAMMTSDDSKTAARKVLNAVKANEGVLEAATMFPGVQASSTTQPHTGEDPQ